MDELQCGWTSKSNNLPQPNIKDIENYLLHSSHRTEDSGKMQCYRQYIRGLNFYKEGYIHKIMYNSISDDSELCYVRSKCYPSMKKGVYEQWLLLSKRDPFRVEKAGCTCPAGLVHFFSSKQIHFNLALKIKSFKELPDFKNHFICYVKKVYIIFILMCNTVQYMYVDYIVF